MTSVHILDLRFILYCRQQRTYFAQVSGKMDSDGSSKQGDVVCIRWHELLFHCSYSSLGYHLNAKYIAVSTSKGASKNGTLWDKFFLLVPHSCSITNWRPAQSLATFFRTSCFPIGLAEEEEDVLTPRCAGIMFFFNWAQRVAAAGAHLVYRSGRCAVVCSCGMGARIQFIGTLQPLCTCHIQDQFSISGFKRVFWPVGKENWELRMRIRVRQQQWYAMDKYLKRKKKSIRTLWSWRTFWPRWRPKYE